MRSNSVSTELSLPRFVLFCGFREGRRDPPHRVVSCVVSSHKLILNGFYLPLRGTSRLLSIRLRFLSKACLILLRVRHEFLVCALCIEYLLFARR